VDEHDWRSLALGEQVLRALYLFKALTLRAPIDVTAQRKESLERTRRLRVD